MILYLARNESVNLLDGAASEKSLHIRKMSGNFSLSEFTVREMRKFASCNYFCIDRRAITEKDGEFIEALQSFQTMFSARIIVIHESTGDKDNFTRGLIQNGVTDIVTAADMTEKLEQIAECLSDDGMQRYKPKTAATWETDDEPDEEKGTLAQSLILKDLEDEQYRFDCLNIKIGIIGATRRVGTTTISLELTNFIKNHGGTSCYVALNTNNHLESIAAAYNFDTEEDYYTFDAIDFYEGILPKHDYNFIITDYGDMKREAVRKYKESDVHLFCGASSNRFEITEFAEALKQIKSVKPQIITNTPNPEHRQLFNSAVTDKPTIIKSVKNMLDFKANRLAFKGVVQPYIVETSKRL